MPSATLEAPIEVAVESTQAMQPAMAAPAQLVAGNSYLGGVVTGIVQDNTNNGLVRLTVQIQANSFFNTATAIHTDLWTTGAVGWGNNNVATSSTLTGNATISIRNITIAASEFHTLDLSHIVTGLNYSVGTNNIFYPYIKSPKQALLDKMRKNLTPEIVTKNRYLWGVNLTEQEVRARTLLYEMIGEREFRRFLRKGFIMVTGASGTLYKIAGGHNLIISFVKNQKGQYVPHERFCVQFEDYNLPYTDGILMRKLLVEFDEFQLRKASNVWAIESAPAHGLNLRAG